MFSQVPYRGTQHFSAIKIVSIKCEEEITQQTYLKCGAFLYFGQIKRMGMLGIKGAIGMSKNRTFGCFYSNVLGCRMLIHVFVVMFM